MILPLYRGEFELTLTLMKVGLAGVLHATATQMKTVVATILAARPEPRLAASTSGQVTTSNRPDSLRRSPYD